jgi:hypothetical protein
VLQLTSLLHTCLKITGAKTGKAPVPMFPDQPGEASRAQQQCRNMHFALDILQRLQEATAQLAARCSSSSSSGTKVINSSKKSAPSTGSSSSRAMQQASSSYAAFAFLHVAGVNLQIIEQAVACQLQVGDLSQQQLCAILSPQLTDPILRQPDKLYVRNRPLADVLSQCLQHVQWLGVQLQQLVLPGQPDKAAAALQDLQEQQLQLQQELVAAIWRLDQAFESAQASDREREQAAIRAGFVMSAGMRLSPYHAEHHTHEVWQLVGRTPTGPYLAAAAQRSEWTDYDLYYMLAVDLASKLVGEQLLRQLRQFGAALWAALPQPHCCNNAGCSSLGSISEVKLVARKGSRCSNCQVAR